MAGDAGGVVTPNRKTTKMLNSNVADLDPNPDPDPPDPHAFRPPGSGSGFTS